MNTTKKYLTFLLPRAKNGTMKEYRVYYTSLDIGPVYGVVVRGDSQPYEQLVPSTSPRHKLLKGRARQQLLADRADSDLDLRGLDREDRVAA